LLVRASRISLALGVMLAGLCAAWPFRHSAPLVPPPLPPAAPLELTLRRPDAPLELAPNNEVSPAIGLEAVARTSPAERIDPSAIARERVVDLANLAPPPALPVSFQPAAASPPANDWRPEPLTGPARPAAKPRAYRIRDGDTLEKIAERLLGDRQRAAEIFEANREVLAQPDLLPVGVTILLPPRQRTNELEPASRN
jgi:nucleoid-associated protein YgaU